MQYAFMVQYLLACMGFLVLGLVILRVIVRRDYHHRGKLSGSVSFLQAMLWFGYGGFPFIFLDRDWPAVHVGLPLHVLGLSLIFTGIAGVLIGMHGLGNARSLGLGEPFLQRSGWYRITRNPQALACALYPIGFALTWPSVYALGWALMYFVLIHAMVVTEEEHLRRLHGEPYERYCGEVPRYFLGGDRGLGVRSKGKVKG